MNLTNEACLNNAIENRDCLDQGIKLIPSLIWKSWDSNK